MGGKLVVEGDINLKKIAVKYLTSAMFTKTYTQMNTLLCFIQGPGGTHASTRALNLKIDYCQDKTTCMKWRENNKGKTMQDPAVFRREFGFYSKSSRKT